MKTSELNRPLSTAETNELRAFLDSVSSAKSLLWADGFLAGVASMPTMLMPSDWVPELLGGHELGSVQEAERIFGLIMRLYNQILNDLNDGLEVPPSDSLEVAEWCQGYLVACRMDTVWREDEVAYTTLFRIGVLAGEFDLAAR